jgi:RES domain-containing protein
MILWRVSRFQDLKGIGGLKISGRWHMAGRPIVYLAENPSGALLEVCVHTASNDLPPDFTLLQIAGPDLAVPTRNPTELPANWTTNVRATREIGDEWLAGNSSVLFRVPSVIVPHTFNVLFNPQHPHAKQFDIRQACVYPNQAVTFMALTVPTTANPAYSAP